MTKNVGPIVPCIPADATRRVDFDWHDLADLSALNYDYGRANATTSSAPFLAASDVIANERVVVCDICPWYDVRGLNVESMQDP